MMNDKLSTGQSQGSSYSYLMSLDFFLTFQSVNKETQPEKIVAGAVNMLERFFDSIQVSHPK